MPLNQDTVDALSKNGTEWKVTMLNAPCESPGGCAYGCCCPWCFTYQQRKELLELTGEPYVCCGGICSACSCIPFLSEPQNENCLIPEVCCCLGMAVSGNRFMLQTRFLKMNDPCDDCIMCCSACLSCVACILKVTGAVDDETADAISCLADCVACSVMSCMLTQQQVEIANLKELGQKVDYSAIKEFLPPTQQKMLDEAKPLKS
mmetsp:Transcript_103512/g.163448  ORF Transcript_103512/g.163448 Transcript_103512/m.163448 type:complete len:205 (+) Transcript_103512:67-681(+)